MPRGHNLGGAARAWPPLLSPDRAQGAPPHCLLPADHRRQHSWGRVRLPARRPDLGHRLLHRRHDPAHRLHVSLLHRGRQSPCPPCRLHLQHRRVLGSCSSRETWSGRCRMVSCRPSSCSGIGTPSSLAPSTRSSEAKVSKSSACLTGPLGRIQSRKDGGDTMPRLLDHTRGSSAGDTWKGCWSISSSTTTRLDRTSGSANADTMNQPA